MKTWIALIRGINVGGRHVVPMKELVDLMEKDGFHNVKTYIQSGNVVFRHTRNPQNRIGELIESRYGFKPDCFVLSREDLEAALAKNPYKTEVGKESHFFFFNKTPMSVNHAMLEQYRAPSESFKLIDNILYLHAPDGIGRSKLVEKLDKAVKGVTMTARNLNTMKKLAEMSQ